PVPYRCSCATPAHKRAGCGVLHLIKKKGTSASDVARLTTVAAHSRGSLVAPGPYGVTCIWKTVLTAGQWSSSVRLGGRHDQPTEVGKGASPAEFSAAGCYPRRQVVAS